MKKSLPLILIALAANNASASENPLPMGLNLKGFVTADIEPWESDVKPYDKHMIMYDVGRHKHTPLNIDSLYVFATPTTKKLMFMESRTDIDPDNCEPYKTAFEHYVLELFPEDETVKLQGGAIGHRTSGIIASSECFSSRTDKNNKVYKSEFVANFTDTDSYSVYESERVAIITGVKLD